jgi:hypothetical protein
LQWLTYFSPIPLKKIALVKKKKKCYFMASLISVFIHTNTHVHQHVSITTH